MRMFLFLLELVYFFLAFKTGKSIYFIIAIILFIWWFYEYKKATMEADEQVKNDSIKQIEKIPHTRYIISPDFLRAMIFDENENMLYITQRKDIDSDFEHKKYPFEDIFEVAIVEDESITSLISKGGVQGWSLIGDENSKKIKQHNIEDEETEQETEDEVLLVKKLSIRLAVNDLSNPVIEYVLMEDEEGLEKDSEDYKELLKECKKWHQKITVIIKCNEKVPVLNWI